MSLTNFVKSCCGSPQLQNKNPQLGRLVPVFASLPQRAVHIKLSRQLRDALHPLHRKCSLHLKCPSFLPDPSRIESSLSLLECHDTPSLSPSTTSRHTCTQSRFMCSFLCVYSCIIPGMNLS